MMHANARGTAWTASAGPPAPPGRAIPAEPDRLPAELLAAPVLIVEDEAMIAWMLEDLLEDMGFAAITVAATGEEAVAAAARSAPGLIVSDINLGAGALDGVGAAATIRATVPAPVLFVTGHAGDETLDRIRQDVPGAPVLRKPISPDALRHAVRDLLARPPAN